MIERKKKRKARFWDNVYIYEKSKQKDACKLLMKHWIIKLEGKLKCKKADKKVKKETQICFHLIVKKKRKKERTREKKKKKAKSSIPRKKDTVQKKLSK